MDASALAMLEVEVVYALPMRQILIKIRIPQGSTLEQAVYRSGIIDQFPEIDLTRNRTGIFGRLSKIDTVLQPNDRIEIYRPLLIDPKEARRLRVSEKISLDEQ